MSTRAFTIVVTALLLVAGLIVYAVIPAAPEPEAQPEFRPSKMYWADGTELDMSQPQAALIAQRAKYELADVRITDKELNSGGYAIELTIDPKVQAIAERAVEDARAGQPGNLRAALVAVDPKTGRIVAYKAHQRAQPDVDFAMSWQNTGPAFFPFVVVALLHQDESGRGLDQVYNGVSGRKFGGVLINNTDGGGCGEQCTVREAMRMSINTVFADIVFNEVGTTAVAKAAIEAGIPEKVGPKDTPLAEHPDLDIALGGGKYVVRPVDMAGAYATFAADGVKNRPHLLAKVKAPLDGGKLIYDGDQVVEPKVTMNTEIARTVTESLSPAEVPCAENRPCAGKPSAYGCPSSDKTKKTDNCATWTVGYTPQISTAVWFGSSDQTALKDASGAQLTGKGLSAKAWQAFMDEYLKGKPVEQFPGR